VAGCGASIQGFQGQLDCRECPTVCGVTFGFTPLSPKLWGLYYWTTATRGLIANVSLKSRDSCENSKLITCSRFDEVRVNCDKYQDDVDDTEPQNPGSNAGSAV
jgi:hypothetical protein